MRSNLAWQLKKSIPLTTLALKGRNPKLSTWRDGFRILGTIANLYRAERPLPFFAGIGEYLLSLQ